MRKLTGYAGLVVGVIGVVMSLYHVYARLTPAAPDGLVLRIIALAFCLVLAFLPHQRPARRGRHAAGRRRAGRRSRPGPGPPTGCDRWAPIAGLSYLFINYTERFPTAHPLTVMDITVATVVVVLVLEATRRTRWAWRSGSRASSWILRAGVCSWR